MGCQEEVNELRRGGANWRVCSTNSASIGKGKNGASAPHFNVNQATQKCK